MASIGNLYVGLGHSNPCASETFKMLYIALVKGYTTKPMAYSKVMPMEPFRALFSAWPDNMILDIHKLRIKTIVLLA